MSLPRGYIHKYNFHDIHTSFFFETTWPMYDFSLQSTKKKKNFCFIDRYQVAK